MHSQSWKAIFIFVIKQLYGFCLYSIAKIVNECHIFDLDVYSYRVCNNDAYITILLFIKNDIFSWLKMSILIENC